MIDPKREDIGRAVVYFRRPDLTPEVGTITSFNERGVFVQYGLSTTSQITSREDLWWGDADPGRTKAEVLTGLRDLEYMGDGLYAGHDGYQVWAFAYNGVEVLARVALPPDGTWQKLRAYADERYATKPLEVPE